MTTPQSAASSTLAEILAKRDDAMIACRESPWLAHLLDMPENASTPLAMSPPHSRAVGSYGAEWVEWMRSTQKVDPRWWQQLAAMRQLEHDEDGELVYREIIESGPRRIGKSVRLRGTALWRVQQADRIGEDQLAMLVSKDLAVGKEIHRGAWRWCEQSAWKVTRLGGAQEVETPKGDGRWLLRAPNAAYGYDVGYGQGDEAWDIDPMAITDGLEPALLERMWPQLHLTSTAHVRASSLMRRRLLAALRNSDESVLLLLWGAPPGADYADESMWRLASPHWSKDRRELMARKYAAALAGQDEPEFDDPDPVRGWAAQYLNVWPLLESSEKTALPGWDKVAVSSPSSPVPLALAVAHDPTQMWLSLGASIDGERKHLALIDRRRVTDLLGFVANVARIQGDRKCPVLVRAKNFLLPSLANAGVNVTVIDPDERAQAHADLAVAVENATVTHGDYPDLNKAVQEADWRLLDGRRVLDATKADISALDAVALALHGATSPPQTGPKPFAFFS